MDARMGLLIGGGTAASVAVAVTCTLMLANAAALSDHAAQPVSRSSVTVPRLAAEPPSAPALTSTVSSVVAPPPVVIAPRPARRPASAPVSSARPVSAGPVPPHAQTHPADADRGGVGRVQHRRFGDEIRAHRVWHITDGVVGSCIGADDQDHGAAAVARTVRALDLMKTPASPAGQRSGPAHPRADTGPHGR